MGMLLYPVFDPPRPRARATTTGEFLARCFEALDAGEERLGLTPITGFADGREIPEDFDGDPDELADLMEPCDEWFDAAEGSRAAAALADAITAAPGKFRGIDKKQREAVLGELRDLAEVLGRAAARGQRFRLELS